jgi:diacylglycerol kinase family enzyme
MIPKGTRPKHPVLIMNPWSGGGKAERFGLVDECLARGIEPVVMQRGDDLVRTASDAVSRGADAIGAAGGDGSQAFVASVASQHDIPYVCVPAGTRNHFAFDVGVDRDDVVGALDAFVDGSERRIDLSRVNERVFVNNASMGVYAKIVRSGEYRNAKLETIARLLPELLPPRGDPFDLRFTAPDGTRWNGTQVVLVSNNPYRVAHPGTGNRGRVDAALLGVIAARLVSPTELHSLLSTESTGAIPRFPGVLDFSTPTFTVDADAPVDVALDGEPLVLDPPLRFESLPSALRIRVLDRGNRRNRRGFPVKRSTGTTTTSPS